MGSKNEPKIANIYLLCLKKKFIAIYHPPFYTRFIYDIFSGLPYDFVTNLSTDNNIFYNLKLNEDCNDKRVFFRYEILSCYNN